MEFIRITLTFSVISLKIIFSFSCILSAGLRAMAVIKMVHVMAPIFKNTPLFPFCCLLWHDQQAGEVASLGVGHLSFSSFPPANKGRGINQASLFSIREPWVWSHCARIPCTSSLGEMNSERSPRCVEASHAWCTAQDTPLSRNSNWCLEATVQLGRGRSWGSHHGHPGVKCCRNSLLWSWLAFQVLVLELDY